MTDRVARRVLALWRRPEPGGRMIPETTLEIVSGQGIVGDHTLGRMRHLTIVFEDDWRAAAAALGRDDVDPVGRRANVLVSGSGDSGRLIGAVVRVGPVRIDVKGETKPCPVMELAAPGMQEALKPDVRAGVWGRILEGGEIRVGDVLTVESDASK